MKWFNTAAAIVAVSLMTAGNAIAAGSAAQKNFAKVFGKALPPIGFVDFCGRNPADCQPDGSEGARVDLSPERWAQLAQVNSYVNAKIAPVSDQDLYGKAEYWTIPTDAGDCEDYLLLKKKYLQGLGFDPNALLITVVLDEKNEGHAILTVASKQGDFVLDNRRDEILRWRDVSYKFLKRQSQEDPRQWVALIKQSTPAATVSGSKPGN